MLKWASSIFYVWRSLGELVLDLKLFIARDQMLHQGSERFLNKKGKGYLLLFFVSPQK